MRELEYHEQCKLIEWAKLQSFVDNRLKLLFHIPNGGHRHISVAKKMKNLGVRPGCPDLFLPVSRKGYHGLFIEMKSMAGKTSEYQQDFIAGLRKNNYRVSVCFGFDAAKKEIEEYLK